MRANMVGMGRGLMALGMVAVLLGGCAPDGQKPNVAGAASQPAAAKEKSKLSAKATKVEVQQLAVKVPDNPRNAVTFDYKDQGYIPGPDFIAAIKADADQELETVRPATSRIGGKILISLTAPENMAFAMSLGNHSEQAQKYAVQYFDIANRLAAEAVKRSNLFDSVTIETWHISPPYSVGYDYAMWKDGDIWLIRQGQGPRTVIFNSLNGVSDWVSRIPASVQGAKRAAEDSGNGSYSTLFLASGPIFQFKGKEYLGAADLEAAMNAAMLAEARAVPKVSPRPGGKAKVVLTGKDGPSAHRVQGIAQSEMVNAATRAHAIAIARSRVEALRSSGAFDSLTVENAEVTDVAADNNDVVLWQRTGQPFVWMFKVKGGEPQHLPAAGGNGGLKEWVGLVASSIAQSRRPKS